MLPAAVFQMGNLITLPLLLFFSFGQERGGGDKTIIINTGFETRQFAKGLKVSPGGGDLEGGIKSGSKYFLLPFVRRAYG